MAVTGWFAGNAVAVAMLMGGPALARAQDSHRVPASPAGDEYLGWHWGMMEDGWHSGFGYGHWAFSLFFWVLIVGAIVLALRMGNGRRRAPARRAREILDERYARGEIDQPEYLRRRNDLEKKTAEPRA